MKVRRAFTWTVVDFDNPCPTCGCDDRCAIASNGAVTCRRVSDAPKGYRRVSEHGGGATFVPIGARRPPTKTLRRAKTPAAALDPAFAAYYKEELRATTREMLTPWARRLGVSSHMMERYGWAVGKRLGQSVLVIPERNSRGELVGLCDRFPDGEKRTRKGSHRGLITPAVLPARVRKLVVGEGGTDTLAEASAHKDEPDALVIGRAAKGACLDEVVALAAKLGVSEAVIWLDADDTNPSAGGLKLGRELARAGVLTRLVRPPGAKDFREWWRQEETTEEVVQRLVDSTEPLQAHEPWPLYVGRDGLEDVPLPWTIHDLIPDGALVGFISPPGGGKTTTAHAIVAAITSDTSFFTRRVKGGPVLLVTAEGRANLGPRLYAAFRPLGDEKTDEALRRLARCYHVPPLQNAAEMKNFIARVDRLRLGRPVVVVIDTLAACMVGDENDNSDMKDFVNGCRAMIDAWGSAVVILHHLRKDGAVERGSSVWKAALDVMVRVELSPPRQDGSPRMLALKVEKARDFAPPPDLVLEMCAGERAVYLRESKIGGIAEAKAALRAERSNPVLRTLRASGTWMKLEDIVKRASLSRRQVQDHLLQLRKQRLVARRMAGKTAEFNAVRRFGVWKGGAE